MVVVPLALAVVFEVAPLPPTESTAGFGRRSRRRRHVVMMVTVLALACVGLLRGLGPRHSPHWRTATSAIANWSYPSAAPTGPAAFADRTAASLLDEPACRRWAKSAHAGAEMLRPDLLAERRQQRGQRVGLSLRAVRRRRSAASSDCRKANGLLLFDPLTDNDMAHSSERRETARRCRMQLRPAAADARPGPRHKHRKTIGFCVIARRKADQMLPPASDRANFAALRRRRVAAARAAC